MTTLTPAIHANRLATCLVRSLLLLSLAGCQSQLDSAANPSDNEAGEVSGAPAAGSATSPTPKNSNKKSETAVRFATFNTAMNRPKAGQLLAELQSGKSQQAQAIAEIIQHIRPDVILINEIDHDTLQESIEVFRQSYLAVGQREQQPIEFAHIYIAKVNTGVETGLDFDGNGRVGGPGDCYGFGQFPGKYGMAVLSRYPIDHDNVRTFRRFLWKDMPSHQMPVKPDGDEPFYNEEVVAAYRLSSKSHWDLPIQTPAGVVHFLCCHPTPPVFDGAEDRNGRRNHDEIRFWADYVTPEMSSYIYCDEGQTGGLATAARFIIAGDLNADPMDGESTGNPIKMLLARTAVGNDPEPKSRGGVERARLDGGKNAEHKGDPACDTGDFNDKNVGNYRIDYVLPSRNLRWDNTGVFWPADDEYGSQLVTESDHRLVWLDVVRN